MDLEDSCSKTWEWRWCGGLCPSIRSLFCFVADPIKHDGYHWEKQQQGSVLHGLKISARHMSHHVKCPTPLGWRLLRAGRILLVFSIHILYLEMARWITIQMKKQLSVQWKGLESRGKVSKKTWNGSPRKNYCTEYSDMCFHVLDKPQQQWGLWLDKPRVVLIRSYLRRFPSKCLLSPGVNVNPELTG